MAKVGSGRKKVAFVTNELTSVLADPSEERLDPIEIARLRPPFLYTVTQIATLLNVDIKTLRKEYLYAKGVDAGSPRSDQMLAINIGQFGQRPRWRVSDGELFGWMDRMGFNPLLRSYLVPREVLDDADT